MCIKTIDELCKDSSFCNIQLNEILLDCRRAKGSTATSQQDGSIFLVGLSGSFYIWSLNVGTMSATFKHLVLWIPRTIQKQAITDPKLSVTIFGISLSTNETCVMIKLYIINITKIVYCDTKNPKKQTNKFNYSIICEFQTVFSYSRTSENFVWLCVTEPLFIYDLNINIKLAVVTATKFSLRFETITIQH